MPAPEGLTTPELPRLRYPLAEESGRGMVCAIHRGTDEYFGRDVIKVLHERRRSRRVPFALACFAVALLVLGGAFAWRRGEQAREAEARRAAVARGVAALLERGQKELKRGEAIAADAHRVALVGDGVPANDPDRPSARAAVLAASGAGKDAPKGTAARAALRAKALDWLRADLTRDAKLAASKDAKTRADVAGRLREWLGDDDFTSVRDSAGLAKLPENEARRWRSLWADVRTTIARADGRPPTRDVLGMPRLAD